MVVAKAYSETSTVPKAAVGERSKDLTSGESHMDSRPGPEIFINREVPLKQKVIGSVNGTPFTILGTGAGGRLGKLGKWICTNVDGEASAKSPIAWPLLAPTFAYGFKVAEDESEKIPYFQACFPDGFWQKRTTRFTRMFGDDNVEEGVIESYHDITLRAGLVGEEKEQLSWIVHCQVNLTATIKEGSPLLESDALLMCNDAMEKYVPCGDGFKSYVQSIYPIKNSPEGDQIIATQSTLSRPYCIKCHTQRKEDPMIKCPHREAIPLPPAHYKKTASKQWRDEKEPKDHVMQQYINETLSFAK